MVKTKIASPEPEPTGHRHVLEALKALLAKANREVREIKRW